MITSAEQINKIYRSATPKPNASLEQFRNRIKSCLKRLGIADAYRVNDALYLSPESYRKKYRIRKTYIEIDGEQQDLQNLYTSIVSPTATYRTFYQRVKRLEKQTLQDASTIQQAATLLNDEWITLFGGGRRRQFVYNGSAFPDRIGQVFPSITSFLREVGKYGDRDIIWSRLKRGWDLDEAIIEPVLHIDDRSGIIYLISCSRSPKQYVGLTRMTTAHRWRHHVRVAIEGKSRGPFAKAIRKWGQESFTIEILEEGLSQEELPDQEKFWIKKLNTLKPNGYNSRPGGQIGGGQGREIEYEGEIFHSLEAAASVLSDRTGIAKHVVLRRLSRGQRIPHNARSQSNHPEAGTNLWRRWKSLINSVSAGRRDGQICKRWEHYDNFAADVREGYQSELLLVRIDNSREWGPDNVEWVTKRAAIESVHGTSYEIEGKVYPSLNAVARAFGIGRTTLKNRLEVQGLSIEETVRKTLGPTSRAARKEPVIVDGKEFASINQAAKYAASKYQLTFDQARDRIRRNVRLDGKDKSTYRS